MMEGVKKEGVSVLDKISNGGEKVTEIKEEKSPVNHSTQTTVLTLLAVIAIVGGLFILFNGGITGATVGSVGTYSGQGAAANTLSESLGQNASTSTSESDIIGSDDGTGSEVEANLPNSQTQIVEEESGTNSNTNSNADSNSDNDNPNNAIHYVDSSRTEDPIYFELEFNNIPEIDSTVSLSEITLLASNLGSSVRINGDLLEATSEVTIDLSDFLGRLKINAHTVTLEGSISKIYLNGVSILSESEIEIEIDALNYDSISTEDMSFSYMYLQAGDGQLKVIDRLSYELEDDSLDIYDFYGTMIISMEDNYPMALLGEAESLESSSNILQLGIQ